VGEINSPDSHEFIAGPHASSAEDALIGIEVIGGVRGIERLRPPSLAESLNGTLPHSDITRYLQKLAPLIGATYETSGGMVRNGQLNDGSSQCPDFIRFRINDHALLCGCCTGCRQTSNAIDLDDAEPTAPEGLEDRVVTKGWHVMSRLLQCFQDGGSLRGRSRPTVNHKTDFLHRSNLLRFIMANIANLTSINGTRKQILSY
jgi:hypothetical protein